MTPAEARLRRVVLRGRGHPAVRAVHAKTIELTADRDLSERGTCIVAVDVDLGRSELRGLRGRGSITLSTDAGARETISGTLNPDFRDHRRLVIRRSTHRAADTLLFAADKAASDLDRAIVAVLTDPGTVLTVTVVAEDNETGPVTVATAPVAGRDDVVVTDLPIGATLAAHARRAAVGTPPHLAAALTAAPPGPITFAGRTSGDAATLVREVRPAELARVLAEVADRDVAVVLDPGTPDERVLHGMPEGPLRAKQVVIVVGPPGDDHDGGLDAFLGALLDAGVALRTVQDALVATGENRRRAYERLLRIRDRR